MTDPSLERWRLILGDPAAPLCGLSATGLARDSALEWLYGRDEDRRRRGERTNAPRHGGTEPSMLSTVDWLDEISRLFPTETIERLERDAVERYEINDLVTDPDVLGRITPNQTLLKAVLRTKHLMDPRVLHLARKLVEQVVRDLVAALSVEVRRAFSGAKLREPSRFRQARNLDVARTIRRNLQHYQPTQRRLAVQNTYFFARGRRHLRPWQVILLVPWVSGFGETSGS